MIKNYPLLSTIIFLVIIPTIIFAQDCEYDYVSGNDHPFLVDSAIGYSDPANPPPEWTCTDTPLVYDIYYPSDYDFNSLPPLPAVFLIHGGGFHDGSTKGKMAGYGEKFAKRNFIAINVQYRTGRNDDPSCFTVTTIFSAYRAIQDVRAAIRKVVADQKSATPPYYRIDTNGLYIGGSSAGAVTAMMVAWYDQKEMNKGFPSVNKCLGGINDKTHYLPPHNKQQFQIRGVFSISGAIYKKLAAINPGGAPIIMFHGENDHILPYYFEEDQFCDDIDLPEDCDCEQFVPSSGSLATFGSDTIDHRLSQLGICYEFHHDPDGGHVLSNCDFGLGTSTLEMVREYVVERTCCFFKSVRCGTCSSDPSLVDYQDEVNTTCDGYSQRNSVNATGSESFYKFLWDNERLQIDFKTSGSFQVSLISVSGVVVASMRSNDSSVSFDLAEMSPGMYLIKVSFEENVSVEKILKL